MKLKFVNKAQILRSKFSIKGSSTLYTRNLNLSKLSNKNILCLRKPNGFSSIFSYGNLNQLFKIGGTRSFHKSSVFQNPNFFKNLFSSKDSASDTDTENAGSLLWLRFLNLFSTRLAERYAYNKVNNIRVNQWRNNVARAQNENNESNPNINTNSDINNNNSNNINVNNNNNISNSNYNNNNENNNNNNNNNNDNVNPHNNSSSCFHDDGGDIGE